MARTSNQWVFGRNPVLEAFAGGKNIDKVFLLQGTRGEFEISLRNLCSKHDVPLVNVPKAKLDKMVRGNHQGVIAILAAVEYHKLDDLIPFWFENGKSPKLLMLDEVTDVRNFGAIARSAEVFGIDALIVGMNDSAPINDLSIKASSGALLRLKVCREKSLVNGAGIYQSIRNPDHRHFSQRRRRSRQL